MYAKDIDADIWSHLMHINRANRSNKPKSRCSERKEDFSDRVYLSET